MKIYGVKYEDWTNGEPSWVDDDIHKTLDAAKRCAKQCADEMVADMNEVDDVAPYHVRETVLYTDLPVYQVLDYTNRVVEQWSVVEFNLVDSAKN